MFGRKRDVVLVGCGPLARETVKALGRSTRVLGAFSLEGEVVRADLGVPHLGSVAQLAPFLNATTVDEVYLATSLPATHPLLHSTVSLCERLDMPFASPAGPFTPAVNADANASDLADGFLHYQERHRHLVRDAVKRVTDAFVAGLQLMLFLPDRRASR